MEPLIELYPGAEDNGLASMLAQMLRQNLDDHADKKAAFGKLVGRVAIVATDLDMAVTLDFRGGALSIHDGIAGIPDVTVRAGYEQIMQMSLVELRGPLGLPDPKGEVAREVFSASVDGRIVVHGALAHLPLMARLTRVMSVR